MRITNSILFRMAKRQVNNANEKVAKYQHQLSSGKKIIRPSDDPVAANRTQQLHHRKLRTEQYARNITMATSWFKMTESVLSDYHGQLVRLKELAIQQGSDQFGPEVRDNATAEVRQIRNHLLSLANTKNGNLSIFAGYNVHSQAFALDGSYSGDSGRIFVNLSRDIKIQLNQNGDEVFETAPGKNIFETVDDFITALQANDAQTIREGVLDEIDFGQRTANRIRADVGAYDRTMQNMDKRLDEIKSNTHLLLGDIEEVDITQAAINLESARSTFQAALMSAAHVGQLSLVNFL